jgi:alpha-L-fucosidase
MTEGDQIGGDYGTPEQEIPANGLPGIDWESCMTMNGTWGFHKNDLNWKSARTLIENLVDCASKGGNYLLNVGPTGLGEIPPASVERLAEVGKWVRANGEAVYGTHAGPFPRPLPWGRVTQKDNKLFLVRFENGATSLRLEGLRGQLTKAYPLANPSQLMPIMQDRSANPTSILRVPAAEAGSMPTVYVVEFSGKLEVEAYVPTPDNGVLKLGAKQAESKGEAHFEADKNCIGFWTGLGDTVSWSFKNVKETKYTVEVEYACDAGSEGATFTVSVGGASVKGIIKSTGSWSKFATVSLGTLVVRPGKQSLVVKAVTMPNGAVMNLRSVTLKESK